MKKNWAKNLLGHLSRLVVVAAAVLVILIGIVWIRIFFTVDEVTTQKNTRLPHSTKNATIWERCTMRAGTTRECGGGLCFQYWVGNTEPIDEEDESSALVKSMFAHEERLWRHLSGNGLNIYGNRVASKIRDSGGFVFAGFGLRIGKVADATYEKETEVAIIVPNWATFVVSGAICFFAIRRRNQKRNWIALGKCHTCGYDLRATKDRCPECGTPIPGLDK